MDVDVVVVGAGLSGLACARRLAQAGVRVAVVEARDRVGGRTLSREVGGARFDLGGQWITPKQRRATALAAELGLSTFRTFHEGAHALVAGGAVTRYRGVIPRMPLLALSQLAVAVARTYASSAWIPRRLDAAGIAAYDGRAAEELARSLRAPEGRASFDAAFRTVFGAEAKELSLYWCLHYLRAGRGFLHLVDVEGGAQEVRFELGAQELSLALARELGDAIRLARPVLSATQDARGVVVRCEGLAIRASRAVFAIPVPLLGRVRFDPGLGEAREKLVEGAVMGATVKLLFVYDRPFWRERGWSGEAVFERPPLSVTFDTSSRDGRTAALVGFVVGDDARRWSRSDPGENKAAALDALAGVFGEEARRPAEVLEQDWSKEPWSGGCPVASFPPGILAGRAPALRAAVGRLHWAGTETAAEYPGYLEGALEAAERAAREVLARL